MRNLLLNLIAVLLVFSVQGCWAGETKSETSKDGKSTESDPIDAPKAKSVSESSKEKWRNSEGVAVFVEGIKKGDGDYSPIFYELKWSKRDSELVCKDLLEVVNNDLKFSPYVDYADTKHFHPWNVISGAENSEIKYAKNKSWLVIYRPPVANAVADIDNDQEREFLYIMTSHNPYPKQYLYIFRNQPSIDLQINEDKNNHSSKFWKFVDMERSANNLAGKGVHFDLPVWLKELPGFSAEDQMAFRGAYSAFYIYKHDKNNYLIADTLNYSPDSKYSNQNNPWYILFSVSDDGSLSKTCILKRER